MKLNRFFALHFFANDLYIHLSLHCEHVQFCDMSVSTPLVTPIHDGTTCANMVIFLQNGCMCVLKDIVDVKQHLDKNLTSFSR